jgi:hypothetical protein
VSLTLVQVVPGLRPLVCGTGEYALALARRLRDERGLDSRFVVLNAAWRGDAPVEGFAARGAPLTPQGLLPLLEPADGAPGDAVVLHYENYSYGARGLPFWLVSALARWRAASPRRRLVTVFHALFACDEPWRSSFWLSPLQKRLSARLRRTSDAAIALGEEDAARLNRWHPEGRGRVAALSVTSAVGEPEVLAALDAREPRIVVFGREKTRARAYRALRQELLHACRSLGVGELLDVGPAIALPSLEGVRVRALGVVPAPELGTLLSASLAGFFSYPSDDLVKSSVLASYLAHGMFAVTGGRYRNCTGGPAAGTHYWRARPGAAVPDPAARQAVADNGSRWYRAHGHSAVATEAYARLLREAVA